MVFPNLWVRNEAIDFICLVIQNLTPIQVFINIQPLVVPYLREELGYVDEDTIRVMVGNMVNRTLIDPKDHRPGEKLTDRDRAITARFTSKVLSKPQLPAEREDQEERKNFQLKLDILDKRNDLEVVLGKRMNEFIIQAFKANLFYYGGEMDVYIYTRYIYI
jgi:hypothetical protein